MTVVKISAKDLLEDSEVDTIETEELALSIGLMPVNISMSPSAVSRVSNLTENCNTIEWKDIKI